MRHYRLTLFIFRRDLRLTDNTGLMAALRSSAQVIPCFILDPRQLENNPYRSDNGIEFMQASLRDLQTQLATKNASLYFFNGRPEEVIKNVIQQHKIEAIFVNQDYTPFSLQRDEALRKICDQMAIDFHRYGDALLHEPEEVLNQQGKVYQVFTHYFHKARHLPVGRVEKNTFDNYYNKPISITCELKIVSQKNSDLFLKGGRNEGLQLLKNIPLLKNYAQDRNFPAKNATSFLSAHLKFGTISIREFYWTVVKTFGMQHDLIRELYWRNFFSMIIFYYPHVLGAAFNKKYQSIKWLNNTTAFKRWCEGQTGFPIVDAGMRQLNQTGYMPNRLRMITASFLVKDLHIDWRWGERYFAQKLLDYDPAINNGNWQWVASTGCDAQPFFRIFNPWLQQKKFDPACEYIKKWIPELIHIEAKVIHKLYLEPHKILTYPAPMVEHPLESKKTKKIYAQSLDS